MLEQAIVPPVVPRIRSRAVALLLVAGVGVFALHRLQLGHRRCLAATREVAMRARPYADAGIRCAGTHCDVDYRRVRTLLEPDGLAATVRVVPSFHGSRADGFKLYAVRPASLVHRLGLRNGDRIRRIDGLALDTPDRALLAYHRVRTAKHHVIELERDGAPLVLTYEVQGPR